MATITALKAPLVFLVTIASTLFLVKSANTNKVYSPCLDTTVQVSDAFTFAIAFSSTKSFFFNSSLELSPCDRRLDLTNQNSQISVFRPKVDEISLLTINTSSFSPVC
ncbi:CSL ZINC FINGER PROTEIN [Salix koriyanagi]|uniref:CSL ZINC FINGER PROTEIN n=1 Tax=Salix koriyanagi TaxID=2511006 RepID=A0A9Q0X3E7_9ROSI|nr:CSL ZINC FINGER PROTEIN [Salix koriyanagi]